MEISCSTSESPTHAAGRQRVAERRPIITRRINDIMQIARLTETLFHYWRRRFVVGGTKRVSSFSLVFVRAGAGPAA